MELRKLGRAGYRSQCLQFLLPGEFGLVPYEGYCDCWHDVLQEMIGPYRKRRSRVVTFVDPEEVDVNFVPNDAFWDHRVSLESMRLVESDVNEVMNPLIVHWAGVARHDQRVFLANQYLKERFNTSLKAGTCARIPSSGSVRFNSLGRLVRCCQRLKEKETELRELDFRDMCYWGCCEWEPIQYSDCRRLYQKLPGAGARARARRRRLTSAFP